MMYGAAGQLELRQDGEYVAATVTLPYRESVE